MREESPIMNLSMILSECSLANERPPESRRSQGQWKREREQQQYFEATYWTKAK